MKKNVGIIFLYGIIVILLIKIFWFPNSGKTKVELPQEAKEAVNAEVTKITKKIDENGMEHAIISDKENVIQSFYELDDSTKIRLGTVTKLLGIERKQARNGGITILQFLQRICRHSKQIRDSTIKTNTRTSNLSKERKAKAKRNLTSHTMQKSTIRILQKGLVFRAQEALC